MVISARNGNMEVRMHKCVNECEEEEKLPAENEVIFRGMNFARVICITESDWRWKWKWKS